MEWLPLVVCHCMSARLGGQILVRLVYSVSPRQWSSYRTRYASIYNTLIGNINKGDPVIPQNTTCTTLYSLSAVINL